MEVNQSGEPVSPVGNEPIFASYRAGDVDADTYALFVDLSDTVGWPHHNDGFLKLHSVFFSVDKTSNGAGQVRLGVITRIDEIDADIRFVQGISYTNTADRSFQRDRIYRFPIKLNQSGGELQSAVLQSQALNVTAVNTITTLPSAKGDIIPAVGDLVIFFGHNAGSYTAFVSGQYSSSPL